MRKNRVAEFIRHPKKALFKLTAPILVAMLVQTLYNIVDTAFVGRLGADSIAALTFAFPLFFVLLALNSGIGIGMGSRISRFLGAKQKKAAENAAMHGLLFSFIVSVVILIIGIIVLEPMFRLFGASETVLPLAMDYMSIVLYGIFFMFLAFTINSIFSAQGDTKTPMKIQVTALTLNIILDPIFIYVLGLGVKGAAIATVTAFFTSMLLSFYFLLRKSYLKIELCCFKFRPKMIWEIATVGFPASLMMLLISFYIMVINGFMAYFGTNHVAAFGLASRLESLSIMPIVAVSMSLLTLVGMFFGAKRYDLLKGITWYAIKATVIFSSVVGIVFLAFPKLFLLIFTSDPELISIGSAYIRIIVFTFPTMAVASIISRALQGMGFGFPGLVINLVRIILVAIPLSYVFVFFLGYSYLSVAVAMVIGGIASAVVAAVWLELKIKKLNHNRQ